MHVVSKVVYVLAAMVVLPPVLRWASRARWITLASQSLPSRSAAPEVQAASGERMPSRKAWATAALRSDTPSFW